MGIPSINIRDIPVDTIFIPNLPDWLTSNPPQAIPIYPPVVSEVGVPIIDMPGCVEAHEVEENNMLETDDPKGVKIYCDAGMPSYNPIDYNKSKLDFTGEAPVPPVNTDTDTKNIEAPPVPDIPGVDVDCPAPNQPRVGDLTASGDERVVGHEIQGNTCVVLYEPTSAVEKYLPSTNQVSTTASIAVVATAAAAATPLLLRVVKPAVKQLIKRIQKLLGKEPPRPNRAEMRANALRAKKGLPPLKRMRRSKT